MIKIFSKLDPSILLAIINRKDEIEIRTDLVPNTEFIQCASLNMNKSKTFKAHKHLFRKVEYEKYIPQESWVVIQGSVKVFIYDINDILLTTIILNNGDCSINLKSGHNYEILEDNTLVYEFKTGPYLGQEIDKIFI